MGIRQNQPVSKQEKTLEKERRIKGLRSPKPRQIKFFNIHGAIHMTIKELATQFKKSIGDIYKILSSNNFSGYGVKQQLPEEAVAVVVEVLTNNEAKAIAPSQKTEQAEKEIVETSQNGQHIEMKTRLQNASQAMATQTEHQYTEALNQEINNAVTMGALAAATANLAFANAYTETSKALYELGISQQKQLAQSLVEKLSDPAFLPGKTPAENCYKSSQSTANNQLANDWMSITK